jgi:AraC family transcriptional regulator
MLGRASTSIHVDGMALCAMTPTVPARDVPSHVHIDAHWIYVLSGTYETGAVSEQSSVGPGTLIFNPPGTTHRDRFAKGCVLNHSKFVSLTFDATVWSDWCDQAALPTHPIAVAIGDVRGLDSRLAAALALTDQSVPGVEDACFDVFDLTAARYREHTKHAPPWLQRARGILNDAARFGERVTVASIAKQCDVHSVHLARAFRHFYHRAPGEYLRQRKLECALQLLHKSPHSLGRIAAEMGYTDQSHFTRSFIASLGVTPQSYRRLIQKQP